MPEAPLPLWFKLAVSAVFIIVMTVVGMLWRPVSDGLDRWMTATFGLHGNGAITFGIVAIVAVITVWSYRRDKRQGRY